MSDKVIILEDWSSNCMDGCCYDYGVDYQIIVDGQQIVVGTHRDEEECLADILVYLGYNIQRKGTWSA